MQCILRLIIRNLKSRRLRWARHVAHMELSRNEYIILAGKPKGTRRRWADNIKIDLKDVGFDAGDWIDLAQDRIKRRSYVRALMNLRFLKSQIINPWR